MCRRCREEQRSEEERQEILERYNALMDEGFKTLDRMSNNSSDIPHIGEVYQRIMEVFGGAPGFAKHVGLHMLAAKPGGITKQKAFEMMMRLSTKVSESGAAQGSFDKLTDEELQDELRSTAASLQLLEFKEDEEGDQLAG